MNMNGNIFIALCTRVNRSAAAAGRRALRKLRPRGFPTPSPRRVPMQGAVQRSAPGASTTISAMTDRCFLLIRWLLSVFGSGGEGVGTPFQASSSSVSLWLVARPAAALAAGTNDANVTTTPISSTLSLDTATTFRGIESMAYNEVEATRAAERVDENSMRASPLKAPGREGAADPVRPVPDALDRVEPWSSLPRRCASFRRPIEGGGESYSAALYARRAEVRACDGWSAGSKKRGETVPHLGHSWSSDGGNDGPDCDDVTQQSQPRERDLGSRCD